MTPWGSTQSPFELVESLLKASDGVVFLPLTWLVAQKRRQVNSGIPLAPCLLSRHDISRFVFLLNEDLNLDGCSDVPSHCVWMPEQNCIPERNFVLRLNAKSLSSPRRLRIVFSGTSSQQPFLGMHKALYIYSLKALFFVYSECFGVGKLKRKATEHLLPSGHRVEHFWPVSQLRTSPILNPENN